MLVLRRGETGVPGEKPLEATISAPIWRRRQDSNLGHIAERRVPSSLRDPKFNEDDVHSAHDTVDSGKNSEFSQQESNLLFSGCYNPGQNSLGQ